MLEPHRPFDARRLGTRFAMPVFVFQGADDMSTPTAPVAEWLDEIEAPEKALVVVENASHPAFFTHKERFAALLIDRLRPWAVRGP